MWGGFEVWILVTVSLNIRWGESVRWYFRLHVSIYLKWFRWPSLGSEADRSLQLFCLVIYFGRPAAALAPALRQQCFRGQTWISTELSTFLAQNPHCVWTPTHFYSFLFFFFTRQGHFYFHGLEQVSDECCCMHLFSFIHGLQNSNVQAFQRRQHVEIFTQVLRKII